MQNPRKFEESTCYSAGGISLKKEWTPSGKHVMQATPSKEKNRVTLRENFHGTPHKFTSKKKIYVPLISNGKYLFLVT